MKRLVLLVGASVLFLSALGVICLIAECQILRGTPDDSSGFPDGRVFFGGEPPYPYIPTQTPKGPIGMPNPPLGPKP
jgi:hypothetical protein